MIPSYPTGLARGWWLTPVQPLAPHNAGSGRGGGRGDGHGGGRVDDEVLAVADGADGAAVEEHDRLGGREGHPGGKRESVHLGDGAAPRSAVSPQWEGPGGVGGRGRRGGRQAPSNKRGPA